MRSRPGGPQTAGAVIALLLLAFAATESRAQNVLTVPQPFATIQAAIDAAQNGDTVLVGPGTYFERIDLGIKAITVESAQGAAVTTIDGEHLDTVVKMTPWGGTRTLRGFTIRNGRSAGSGGGIRISGAPYDWRGLVNVEDNVVVGNEAVSSGAGIYVFQAQPVLRGNTVRHNTSFGDGRGAGVYVSVTSLLPSGVHGVIDSNLIEGNVTAGSGAGLHAGTGEGRSFLTISRNVIRANCSGSPGAGIAAFGRVSVVNNIISDNRAICGTVTPARGAGVYFYPVDGSLVNNTIVNNIGDVGSAVAVEAGYGDYPFFSATNNILSGRGTTLLHCGFVPGFVPTIRNNDVYPLDGASPYGGACPDLTGQYGNMSVDPQFVDASAQDFHLRPHSRLIDRGYDPYPPAMDIDGDPRPADGNGDGLARVDIGADEVEAAGTPSGAPPILTGAGAGGGPHARAVDRSGGARFDVFAYAPEFTGGVTVAFGDVDGDGAADLVTGAGPGGGPHVCVIAAAPAGAGSSPRELASFYAYDAAFLGGVFVAVGDVTGDGVAEIVTGAGAGGGPHVRVFTVGLASAGQAGIWEHSGFFAFDPAFSGGVRVAVGDLDGDGVGEILTAAGPGGGSQVRAFKIAGGGTVLPILSVSAYDEAFSGGVFVAAGDVDGDGRDDIVTGADAGGGPHVRVLAIGAGFSTLRELSGFYAYDPAFTGGVRVAAGDLDGDGRAEIITGAGPGGGPHVQAVSRADDGALYLLSSFNAYAPAFGGGVFVAAAPR
jgi:parallel beta-helix repeat protein